MVIVPLPLLHAVGTGGASHKIGPTCSTVVVVVYEGGGLPRTTSSCWISHHVVVFALSSLSSLAQDTKVGILFLFFGPFVKNSLHISCTYIIRMHAAWHRINAPNDSTDSFFLLSCVLLPLPFRCRAASAIRSVATCSPGHQNWLPWQRRV